MFKVSMFRVEKPCGTGPYAEEEDHPMLAHMYLSHGDEDHPEPADDTLLNGIGADEVCGFPTLDALEDWFAGYEDPLAELGYEIVIYSLPVSSVRYGHQQAVFVRDHAVPVKTWSLV